MGLALRQAVKKKTGKQGRSISVQATRGMREAAFYAMAAVALFMLIALLSYHASDPGWSHMGAGQGIQNYGGKIGAWFADVLFYLVGILAILAPVMVAISGWMLFRGDRQSGEVDPFDFTIRWLGFFLTIVTGCGLAALHIGAVDLPMQAGGLLGQGVSGSLVSNFSAVGATLLLLACFLGGMTLFTGVSWLTVLEMIGGVTLAAYDWLFLQGLNLKERWDAREVKDTRATTIVREQKKSKAKAKAKSKVEPKVEPRLASTEVSAAPESSSPAPSESQLEKSDKREINIRPKRERQLPLFKSSDKRKGGLPPISLLDEPREQIGGYSESELEELSKLVEIKLLDFKVEAQVESVHPGPVVTRFELMLAPGTRASKITALARDLARSLSVVSVRVVEVIPGKATVGLEIPNEKREMVSLSEILASKRYDSARSPLTLGMGKDIAGRPVVADVAKMPHMLVAGTTGSGKSVAVNAMLLSVLFKATANDVRMILIDPKMLELSVYEGIPHLLTPVVTDMKDAANALRWCVAEMERRYKLMSLVGVRNLAGYNQKVADAIERGEPLKDPMWKPSELLPDDVQPDLEKLPNILIVVDEFADMIMVVGKKVEELIARLAQKARAAGIHLILATQRPSVDVITGLIKANIPTRCAFQVSSKIDSRTILDQTGAEQLLGHGDMLFLPAGTSLPERIHGAFVDDHEVHAVARYLCEQGEPDYLPEILDGASDEAIPGLDPLDSDDDMDPLYDQAVAIVTESRKASISYVQRCLKVGYNRSARMLEQMEKAGVVSATQGNSQREVLAPPPPKD